MAQVKFREQDGTVIFMNEHGRAELEVPVNATADLNQLSAMLEKHEYYQAVEELAVIRRGHAQLAATFTAALEAMQ